MPCRLEPCQAGRPQNGGKNIGQNSGKPNINKNELTKTTWMGFQQVQNAVVIVHEMKEYLYHIKF